MSSFEELKTTALELSRDLYGRFLEVPLPQRVAVGVGAPILYWLTNYIIWRFREKSKPFNKYTTNDDAINNLDLTGKLIIVTGANNGLGLETARVLVKQGAKVIMACRNTKKGENAKQEIINKLSLDSSNDQMEVLELDLSSLESVRLFADKFNQRNEKINYLINNAGIMALPDYRESTDGYEMQFATNHLGHFYLTTLLMPSLLKRNETSGGSVNNERKPRVITLSSSAHRKPFYYEETRRQFLDCLAKKQFMVNKDRYEAWNNYGISKTCNILFARELQRRYGSEIISVSLHPGGVSTGLAQHVDFRGLLTFLYRLMVAPTFFYKNMKPLECGASTTLRCVSLDDKEIEKGHYYRNCQDGDEYLQSVAKASLSDNNVLSSLLWDLSQALIETKGYSINCSGCNPTLSPEECKSHNHKK